jgi:hypothetical protein
MGNDIRKGNRTSVPSRGGLRRSNTPPPPSVRLGIDGLPETEPISTSRPRGNELPKTAPVLENLPADVVAAAKPPESVPPKAPEVVEPVPPQVAAKVAPTAPQATDRSTLHSQPESQQAVVDAANADVVHSQPAPSVAPKRSLPPANRKRGSNLKGALGKSIPPPPAQVDIVTAPLLPGAVVDDVSTAKAPPVADAPETEEAAPESKRPPAHAPDIDDHFFDRGEQAADAHHDASDLEGYDDRMVQKNSPEARARRAKNWRYVLIAGAGCVLVLLIANVINLTGHRATSSDQAVAAATVARPMTNAAVTPKADVPPEPPVQVTVQPAASAAEQVGAAAPSAKAAEPGAPAPAESSKGWVAEPNAAAASPPPSTAEPTADDKKSAAQEKHACQTFLNQGAFAKAVEAGEHSVALDPADGEAWLMLGAAYQSMGKNAEARRSFSSCTAEAKRGPINECRAMLR